MTPGERRLDHSEKQQSDILAAGLSEGVISSAIAGPITPSLSPQKSEAAEPSPGMGYQYCRFLRRDTVRWRKIPSCAAIRRVHTRHCHTDASEKNRVFYKRVEPA